MFTLLILTVVIIKVIQFGIVEAPWKQETNQNMQHTPIKQGTTK